MVATAVFAVSLYAISNLQAAYGQGAEGFGLQYAPRNLFPNAQGASFQSSRVGNDARRVMTFGLNSGLFGGEGAIVRGQNPGFDMNIPGFLRSGQGFGSLPSSNGGLQNGGFNNGFSWNDQSRLFSNDGRFGNAQSQAMSYAGTGPSAFGGGQQMGPQVMTSNGNQQGLPSSMLFRNEFNRGKFQSQLYENGQPAAPRGLSYGQQADTQAQIAVPESIKSAQSNKHGPLPQSILKYRKFLNRNQPRPIQQLVSGVSTSPTSSNVSNDHPTKSDADMPSSVSDNQKEITEMVTEITSVVTSSYSTPGSVDKMPSDPTASTYSLAETSLDDGSDRTTTVAPKRKNRKRKLKNILSNASIAEQQCFQSNESKDNPSGKKFDLDAFRRILTENGKSGEKLEDEIKDINK